MACSLTYTCLKKNNFFFTYHESMLSTLETKKNCVGNIDAIMQKSLLTELIFNLAR